MSKKIDERLPQDSGKGSGLKEYYAIKSPWEKMYGYRDAMHYSNRFEQVIGAACMQAYRIMIPDYRERAQLMCEDALARLVATNRMYGENGDDMNNMHPFMCGQFVGALIGDQGDDALLMCGTLPGLWNIPRGKGAGCLRLGYRGLRTLPRHYHVTSGVRHRFGGAAPSGPDNGILHGGGKRLRRQALPDRRGKP